jgi:hypothetical protein
MWDLILFVFSPFLHSAAKLLEFLYEDDRPEARRITVGCAIAFGVITIASVIGIYLATMR